MAPQRIWIITVGAALLFACVGTPSEDKDPDTLDSDASETDVTTPRDTDTPVAPTGPHALPEDLFNALPKDANGLPVLMTGSPDLGAGIQIALAYDADKSDPITHYGDCLAEVGNCYDGDLDALSTCVAAVPKCSDPAGGDGCCPAACVDAFVAEDALRPTGDAIDLTFVKGDCFEGLEAFRDAEGPAFEVSP